METRVIIIKGNRYSERVGQRCINSGKKYGVIVKPFNAVTKDMVKVLLNSFKLKWTWANNNNKKIICNKTGLQHFPYKCRDLNIKIACSMSHYLLWIHCKFSKAPLLILEHDAVFIRRLPEIDFKSICQINNPKGCTPQGKWWEQQIINKGNGIHNKTLLKYPDNRPDGLAGNSAYMLKPEAAIELISAFHNFGIWPNDATMCIQLFPNLQEYYPFIIETRQEKSTTT